MHRGDAGPEHGAAGSRAPALAFDRDAERQRRQDDREEQGYEGQRHVEADRNTWSIGKHGDEMGRPGATAACRAAHQQPEQGPAAF